MTILCGGRVLIGQFGNTTSVGRGTITVVLQHQGETYLITAGHAVGEEGAAVYAPINDMAPDQPARWSDNEQWDQIGKVVRNLYVTGHNNRDVALVKLVNLPQNVQVHFMRVALGQDIHTLAGFRDLDQEGDEVEFVGWRTGHHRALVTNLEATVEVRDEFDGPASSAMPSSSMSPAIPHRCQATAARRSSLATNWLAFSRPAAAMVVCAVLSRPSG